MTLTRLAKSRIRCGEPAYPSAAPSTTQSPTLSPRDRAVWRQYVGGWASPPAQVKIDFSKMPQRPVSEGFVFPKSTEQKLAEAEAKIADLQEGLEQKLAEAEAKIADLEEALKKYREMREMSKNEHTRYNGVRVLHNKNDVEERGYDGSYSEEYMIQLAIKERCPIVQKSGPKGKWYLKGKDMSHDHLKNMVEMKLRDPTPEHKNKYIILINM